MHVFMLMVTIFFTIDGMKIYSLVQRPVCSKNTDGYVVESVESEVTLSNV